MEVVRCWSRSNLPKPSDPASRAWSRLLTPRRLPVLVELQLLQWHTSTDQVARPRHTRGRPRAWRACAAHGATISSPRPSIIWTYMIPTLTTPMKINRPVSPMDALSRWMFLSVSWRSLSGPQITDRTGRLWTGRYARVNG